MISIVIPAYNEANNILDAITEIQKALSATIYAQDYEIIVVDDHSSDGTFEKVENLQRKNIRAIRLSSRCRSHTAFRAGFKLAKGEAVICISADLQDDPAIIPQMIEKWKAGADVVWGTRKNYTREEEPLSIKIPAFFFYYILRKATSSIDPTVDISKATFFLTNRKVADAINACPERNTTVFGLLMWMGFKQTYVDYKRPLRQKGESKWNFSSRINLAKDWIIAFSIIPLKAITWIGFIIGVLGFLYALFIIFMHFAYQQSVPGWSSLMVVVLVLGGLNMCMLGIIGEYLGRNLDETRRRPLYFIEKDTYKNDKL